MTSFIVRLIRRSDGVGYHGVIESPDDPADALIRAHERFGAEHHIRVVYPEERRWRVGWHMRLAAAMMGPLEGRNA